MTSQLRQHWEKLWSNPLFKPIWADRKVSPEMVQSVRDGWLPLSGRVLDIGCGTGEVSAWFAQAGYEAVGVDIAPQVIEMAIKRHGVQANLNFATFDICAQCPPQAPYDILLDRGCFHQIEEAHLSDYVTNIASVAASSARMMIFIRAYRTPGVKFGDVREAHYHRDRVIELFKGSFSLHSWKNTNMVGIGETAHDRWLPGIVFRLARD